MRGGATKEPTDDVRGAGGGWAFFSGLFGGPKKTRAAREQEELQQKLRDQLAHIEHSLLNVEHLSLIHI